MIVMINERNGHKTKFKNYQKLYNHLKNNAGIYHKPYRPIDDWFFACHSHRRVMAFYEFVNAIETTGKQAKFDVLEISYDHFSKPTLVPMTPDVDIESLLEGWCRRYCDSHWYKLFEIEDDFGILHVKKN